MLCVVRKGIAGVALAGALVAVIGSARAGAEPLSPWWGLTAGSRPTALVRGGSGQIIVTAENLGDGDANGATAPIRIEDTLPSGVKAVSIEGLAGGGHGTENGPMVCGSPGERPLVCVFEGVLRPYEPIEVRIGVTVKSNAQAGAQNKVSVSGGGAVATKTLSRPLQIGAEAQFGLEEAQFAAEEVGGGFDTQAGSHPFQLTSVLELNQTATANPVALPKELGVLAPPGLVGNPTPIQQCTEQQFLAVGQINNCPLGSVIGVATITINEPETLSGIFKSVTPVFNLVPEPGEPARFGFYVAVFPVTLDVSVRTGGDYGVTVSSHNISEIPGLISSKVTLWGVPGDARHDAERGWHCLGHEAATCPLNELSSPPFLTMPTSCGTPLQASAQVASWTQPHEVLVQALSEGLPSLDGCNHLSFDPSISVAPDVQDASTPTGLTVGVHLPQTAALDPTGLAESAVKNVTVAFPEGVALNPAGADGLQACSESLVGFTGFAEDEPADTTATFTPTLPRPLVPGANFCPNASKIGTVRIKTPILPNPLEGAVYLAAQEENPFGSLVAMYIVAEDPVSGVLIKLPGEVQLGEAGQLVASIRNSPQAPLEDAEFHFFGGDRAPLATPARCGIYTTSASFAPWSGSSAVNDSTSFDITTGPGESPCPGAGLPFAPSLTAGTTSIQAGGFTPFTMTMSRPDGNQALRGVSLHMPPGLSGMLAGVTLCGEAQANAGTCDAASLIGETTVSVGLGGEPYTVTGGKVYLTGPYEGAPFGLAIVDPAKAGPFDLEKRQPCDCLVVRARIEVDPQTADLTITSNESGPQAIPSILDGIPLQIKHVNVSIDRAGFTFNPTNCAPLKLTGALSSSEGATQGQTVPFQVTNCASLKFAPKFAVSTSGKTSRADGASLSVKLTYPKVLPGTDANIARVKVELPKRLPSRLTTLQKACSAVQFAANPAGCPSASVVGHARAITPILPVPLEGPAYFVSHGGEAFPSLIVVLQGYGVTVDLVGTTHISKQGITSSTFKSVPDVPVGSFELTLPEGRYSALAAIGSLCKGKLAMPTELIAQNGDAIHRSTSIQVSGCHSVKHAHGSRAKGMRAKRVRKRRKGG
jgi:hypothetical protein